MTVAYRSGSGGSASGSGVTAQTLSIACNAGDTIIAFIRTNNGSSRVTPSSVSFTNGGTTSTPLGTAVSSNGLPNFGSLFAYRIPVTSTGTGTLQVNTSSANVQIDAAAYSGVGSVSGYNGIQNVGSTLSVSPSAANVTGGIVVADCCCNGGPASSITSGTAQFTGAVMAYGTSAGTPTFSWSCVYAGYCAIAVVLNATTGTTVSPGGASVTATSGTPTVTAPLVVSPSGASASVATGTPTVTAPGLVSPSPASVSATGGSPAVFSVVVVSPIGTIITTTGGAPTVTAPDTIVLGGAAASLTAGTPTVTAPRVAFPAGASASVAGGSPTVLVLAIDTIAPGSATITAVGNQYQASQWQYGFTITATNSYGSTSRAFAGQIVRPTFTPNSPGRFHVYLGGLFYPVKLHINSSGTFTQIVARDTV
jgi:hypothetical protein